MKHIKNPFESDQWFATIIENDSQVQKQARDKYRVFLKSQNKSRNWVQTGLYYLNHPALFAARHALLALGIVIMASSIMVAATSELVAPTSVKPSTFVKNLMSTGQSAKETTPEPQILRNDENTYISALDECGIAIKYNNNFVIARYILENTSLFRLESVLTTEQTLATQMNTISQLSNQDALNNNVNSSILCGAEAQRLFAEQPNNWTQTDIATLEQFKDLYLFADQNNGITRVFQNNVSDRDVIFFEYKGVPIMIEIGDNPTLDSGMNVQTLALSNKADRALENRELTSSDSQLNSERIRTVCGVDILPRDFVVTAANTDQSNDNQVQFQTPENQESYTWEFTCDAQVSNNQAIVESERIKSEIKQLLLTQGITNPAGQYQIQHEAGISRIQYRAGNLSLTIRWVESLSPIDIKIAHTNMINGIVLTSSNANLAPNNSTQTPISNSTTNGAITNELTSCTSQNNTRFGSSINSERVQIQLTDTSAIDEINKVLKDIRAWQSAVIESSRITETLNTNCIDVTDIIYLNTPKLTGNSTFTYFLVKNTEDVTSLALITITPDGLINITISSPIPSNVQQYLLSNESNNTITLKDTNSVEYEDVNTILQNLNQVHSSKFI